MMRRRRVRERTMVALAGGLIACATLGLGGGHALAGFAMGEINPFYLEHRWRDVPTRPAEPPPLTAGAQPVADNYSARVRPDWLYGPTPAYAAKPAAYEGWTDSYEASPEPEPETAEMADPLPMIEPSAAEVDEADVAAAGDTAPVAEEPATPEPPAA